MANQSDNGEVSSAEVTAYMRGQAPALTHDDVSHHLVSPEGITKFHDFTQGFSYPLATRKIMVRAGYFYEQALALLQTGKYDCCVSFASGFSMLTYLLSKEMGQGIEFVDIDLPNILALRESRIQENAALFDQAVLGRVSSIAFDLNDAKNTPLKELLPNCKRPLFILEGISYFLSIETMTALLKQICAYDDSGLVMDYWPANSLDISAIFKRIMHQLHGFIAEDLQSYLMPSQIDIITDRYQHITDISICETDSLLSKQRGEKPVLTNQNEVFPIRNIVAHD